MSHEAYLHHLERVAFQDNADLPVDWQKAIETEGRCVLKDFLKPRGLAQRSILLVGGGGYIGIPVTSYLLARGYRVRCQDIFVYENDEAVTSFLGHPNYEFMRGNLAQPRDREAALKDVTDVVILAGLVGDPITKKYPAEHKAINERGLESFVDSLNGRGLNKVIMVSTCSNYGEIPPNALADENYVLKPLSLYAKAKVAREQQVLAAKSKADYSATVLRFSTAFGLSARMRFDLTVSEFTRDLFAGRKLEVYDADTWRPYCHVRDFARGLTRVLEAPRDKVAFQVFNAGGDRNNLTKKMIVEAILRQIPDGQVAYVAGGADKRNYKVNFTKIREVLLFEPAYSVEDGIRELLKALNDGFFRDYDANRDHYGNYKLDYILT
jgi:nucleoside-diphosphate-sugar epimerase